MRTTKLPIADGAEPNSALVVVKKSTIDFASIVKWTFTRIPGLRGRSIASSTTLLSRVVPFAGALLAPTAIRSKATERDVEVDGRS
ncbi:hypothetical protein AC579_4713 [Pseudocercospora musae]|uniref:Uncharacterized protein n=1 Tax=Pseudocercospora musae TaxID=113226 RepID=A0A139I2X2_9PEZI|nr:hypothetical protein AC579_4713 [Pseudocercospora musae]